LYLAFVRKPGKRPAMIVHCGREAVNKSQLIDALSARYEGNRKQAQHALESVLDTITREVAKGEKVAITGFGSFEKRVREARWVRNPQTGARIKAKKTAVPKFTAGADLKNVISGAKKLPKLTLAAPAAAAKKATTSRTTAAKKTTAKKSAAAKKTAKKAPAKTTAAKKTTARKAAPAKKTAATRTTAAKKTAKKAPAKKATATRRTAAKKATGTRKTAAKKSTAAKKTTARKSAPAKKTAARKSTAAKKTARKTAKRA
jgi:DNA-binding protein HU-beta